MNVVVTVPDDPGWADIVRLAVTAYFPGEPIAVHVGDPPGIDGPLDTFGVRYDLAVLLRALRLDWLKTHAVIEPDWAGE